MAKAGARSKLSKSGTDRSEATRQALIEAAIATLKDHGFSGASARVIAERAGVAQGLVFYHFGSVVNLLLAALDEISAERLEIYGAAIEEVTTPAQLVDAAERIFRTDLDSGYITVLVEMIAGASSTPGLGPEVARRIEPWREFARSALVTSLDDSPLSGLVPAEGLAHAVVALYLGLEMLSHLDGNPDPALELFAYAKQFAGLLGALATPTPTKEPR